MAVCLFKTERNFVVEKKRNCTYIGGQAVIQGVMMRGKSGMATVVRDDNGELQTEAKRITPPEKRKKWMRAPFVRGVVNFVMSLVDGMKVLLRSSEAAITDDEEPSKFSKWMAERLKLSLGDVVTAVSAVLGVVLAVGLFIFLPQVFTGLIADAAPVRIGIENGLTGTNGYGIYYHLIEGAFRLVIFVIYILFTLIFKSLRQTYQYHGAEHKTINCFELGKPLNVENVRGCSRLHDRCGTTFIFIVLIVSILILSLIGVPVDLLCIHASITGIAQNVLRFFVRLLFLPVVAGISYEILKLLARTSSPIVLPLKAPGYLLQMLTTREPDDQMIECAIAAFNKAKEMDEDPDSPEILFATETKLSKLMKMMKKSFAQNDIDESDAEWIVSLTLDIPRSSLQEERVIKRAECRKILSIFEERLSGRPLWYIFGNTEFYGYTFNVDERVLIPRPETEILVQQAVSALKSGDSMLDLCTGSGAIAVAVACEAAKEKTVSVLATDVSEGALDLARENARLNKANVTFLKSDLFENVRGRFNIITANPPYIKSEEIASLPKDVRDFEPTLALDGGKDGLEFYRRIASRIYRHVARGGLLIMECGEDQARDVIKIFQSMTHCDYAMVVKDLAGVERFVKIGF